MKKFDWLTNLNNINNLININSETRLVYAILNYFKQNKWNSF